MEHSRKFGNAIAGTLAIVMISALLGMLVSWRAPGLERYAQDWLMRARGTLAAPDDIAILAIDEPSIARFGRFPWPRSVMARAIDAVASGRPRVIALDVLFTDPTTPQDDAALAAAIARAGNVVAAAQLVEAPAAGGAASWLLPLPEIQRAADGVGHVNVLMESEGAARELFVRAADSAGVVFNAMPVEAIRAAERIPDSEVTDTGSALVIGRRAIPLSRDPEPVVLAKTETGEAPRMLRAGRMAIDYIGPSGSFAPTTYSVADVLDGRVSPAVFHGRYVLVGSTAASAGERFPTPFMHEADAHGDQHGTPMPGVEVLANALNTVLRSRFYSETPDWLAFVWAALAAALTLALLAVSQGRAASVKQIAALGCSGGAVIVASYVSFTRFLVVPPLTPAMVSFGAAGLFGLLRRSLGTSARLDAGLTEIGRASTLFNPEVAPNAAAESIAHLTNAAAVAVFAAREGRHLLVAEHGAPVLARLNSGRAVELPPKAAPASEFFVLPPGAAQECVLLLEPVTARGDLLAVAYAPVNPPSAEVLRVCSAIAASCVSAAPSDRRSIFPKGLEEKARLLGRLNSRLLDRTRFVDLALRSVEDGLVIATPDGRITFANRSAAAILESTERALVGRNLFERLAECEQSGEDGGGDLLARLLVDRTPVEREVTMRASRPRQYILRFSGVASGDGPVMGIVASISDITRHKELQQTKNDVISLVSHEMRTPLTAIQGMSELLANYDMDAERRREINQAINDEVKRLTRMITEYLDITRLESGATVLRVSPVRLDAMLERSLMLLDPVAAQRGIRLKREFAPGVPAVVADADLLRRAAENLISNAIKYSPSGTEVTVALRTAGADAVIEVADHGYGISEADQARVFDKFYRVPRIQDADVPGTGLGLSLVREIAELHHGSVSVKSAVNEGSTFTLVIPVNGAASRPGTI